MVGEDALAEAAPALEGNGLRDAGLLLTWVTVFLATFLVGLSFID